MNIEEARDILANVIADEIIGTYCLNEAQKYNCNYCEKDDCIYTKAIEIVLNELDKKDKVMNLMANSLTTDYHDTEWVKEYFYKLAEEILTKKKQSDIM